MHRYMHGHGDRVQNKFVHPSHLSNVTTQEQVKVLFLSLHQTCTRVVLSQHGMLIKFQLFKGLKMQRMPTFTP